MGIVRTVFCTLAAGGLMIAQPAMASATRSSDALPSAGVAAAPAQAVGRGSQPAEATNELNSTAWIALIIALLGGIIAVAAGGGGGNNDSPG